MSLDRKKRMFGDLARDMKLVDAAQVADALKIQKAKAAEGVRLKLGDILVEKVALTLAQLTAVLAKQMDLQFVRISSTEIPEPITKLVPKNIAMEYKIVPLHKKEKVLTVASAIPLDIFTIDNLRFMLNTELEVVLAIPDEINQAIGKYYGKSIDDYTNLVGDVEQDDITQREDTTDEIVEDDAPIIRLVHTIISDAVKNKCSDIHVEPMEKTLRIRYRTDGICREIESPPKRLQAPMTSRIKLMAGMDIAEKRKPQDGRIPITVDGREFDIRVSALPSHHGESVVMRLLEKQALVTLEDLGFHLSDYQRFKAIIKRPNGIFLVTGPTGSGKTTTLAAAVRELNKPNVKIITAEDPVEYVIPGVNQCRVRTDIGFTFASIIRAMLRQAPNIILIGEIRDVETAEIAVQAALTGHLVFSTLHTNDAPSAITRLLDMGVKPFLVAAAVQAVMAQRLIRMLCPKCKQPYVPEEAELAMVGLTHKDIEGRQIYKPVGCRECKEGYIGRKGIFELFEMNSRLKELAFSKEPTLRIYEEARVSGGMVTLLEDGVRKIADGLTTIEEVIAMSRREDLTY